jgi:hypothetical protein
MLTSLAQPPECCQDSIDPLTTYWETNQLVISVEEWRNR